MVRGATRIRERNPVPPMMLNPPNVPAPGPPSDPDVQLMLRVQRGDGSAFTELEQRYAGRVLGYFCRRLGDRATDRPLSVQQRRIQGEGRIGRRHGWV